MTPIVVCLDGAPQSVPAELWGAESCHHLACGVATASVFDLYPTLRLTGGGTVPDGWTEEARPPHPERNPRLAAVPATSS